MSIPRTTMHEKVQRNLAAARKEGRTGPAEAEKERKRGPHTWRKTLKSSR
jgi:hypothetical protein